MAMGTADFGKAPETTDADEGVVERTVERVREFIAHPSRHSDGTVTHRPDAELGYDPADIPPVGAGDAEPGDKSSDKPSDKPSAKPEPVTPAAPAAAAHPPVAAQHPPVVPPTTV